MSEQGNLESFGSKVGYLLAHNTYEIYLTSWLFDMILDSTRKWNHEPDHEELVAEDATSKIAWKQEE